MGRRFNYLESLSKSSSDIKLAMFHVKKQQYLEALCWQGFGGVTNRLEPWKPLKHSSQNTDDGLESTINMELVAKVLQQLENLCSPEEFNDLCTCLALSHISKHPTYKTWSLSRGRAECFQKIKEIIAQHYEPPHTIKYSLETFIAHSVQRRFDKNNFAWNNKVVHLNIDDGEVQCEASLSNLMLDLNIYPLLRVMESNIALPTLINVGCEELVEDRRMMGTAWADNNTRKQSNTKNKDCIDTKGNNIELKTGADACLSMATDVGANDIRSRWDCGSSDNFIAIPEVVQHIDCPVRCISILDAAKSSFVALGTNNKSVQLLHISREHAELCSTKTRVMKIVSDLHKGSVYSCDWSTTSVDQNDMPVLATGSNDKTIALIRNILHQNQDCHVHYLRGHTGTIRVVRFPHCNFNDTTNLAAAGAGDCRPYVWDLNHGTASKMEAHKDHIHALQWLDSNTLISGCEKGRIIAHDTRTTKSIWSIQLGQEYGGVSTFSEVVDAVVMIGHAAGRLSILDTTSRKIVNSDCFHTEDIRSVCLWTSRVRQNDTLFGLTTSFDKQALVLQMIPGKRPAIEPRYILRTIAKLCGHTDKILCGRYSKSLDSILTSGADGNVIIWKANLASIQ